METIGESLYPKRSTKIFLFSSFLAFPYVAFFRLFQFLDNIAYDIIRQCLKYDVLIVDQFIQGRFNDRPCGILLVFIVCFFVISITLHIRIVCQHLVSKNHLSKTALLPFPFSSLNLIYPPTAHFNRVARN